MKSLTVHAALVSLVLALGACGSTGGPALGKAEVSEQDLSRAGWTLPLNYDTEMAHRDITLLCSIDVRSPSTGYVSLDKALSNKVQTELGRIRRFKVYCKFGDGTYRLAEDMALRGELAPRVSRPAKVDLFLNGELTWTEGKYRLQSGNDKLSFQVGAAMQLMDANRTQLWGRNMQGAKVERTAVLGLGGKVLGGTDPSSEADVLKALDESARQILWQLGQTLGKEYPVTGPITNKLGQRFAFAKGSSEGLGENTQMWIWYRMPGGLAIPIGKARAQPSFNSATLEVYAWNTRDEDARRVIEQLDSRRDWMRDASGDREGIFATSAGLPVPPEWDPAHAQYQDSRSR